MPFSFAEAAVPGTEFIYGELSVQAWRMEKAVLGGERASCFHLHFGDVYG
jgi:hypothetical protein